MGKMVGYMVTWTAYGTWLQGDKEGYVKDGRKLKENLGLREANKRELKHKVVRLGIRERIIVKNAITKTALKRGQCVYAITVCSNHVYVVVSYTERDIGRCVRDYKNASVLALRRNGFVGKVWTRGYDKRYCFDEKSLCARMAYVERHNLT